MDRPEVVLIDSESVVEQYNLLGRIAQDSVVAIDTEGDYFQNKYDPVRGESGFESWNGKMGCFSVACGSLPNHAFVAPLDDSPAPWQLLSALDAREGPTWAWNWKHDGWQLSVRQQADAMILAWILSRRAPGKHPFGLKAQSAHFLGYELTEQDWDSGVPVEERCKDPAFLRYAAEDAWACMHLAIQGLAGLEAEEAALRRWVWDVEFPFVEVLAHMERRGLPLDGSVLREIAAGMEREHTDVAWDWSLRWPETSIASPKALSEKFYGEGLWSTDGIPLLKSGYYQTDEAALLRHAAAGGEGGEAAALKLRYQDLHKNIETYLKPMCGFAEGSSDLRLHCQLKQMGTETGRLSSARPNLQNIPKHSEMGKRIRAAVVQPEGRLFVSADYSQIELRVLAHFAGDGVLADAYRSGADIHQRTADLLGCSRQAAKTINFAKIYGSGPAKQAALIGCTMREASIFMQRYEAAYPEVLRVVQRAVDAARKNGRIRTISRRFRPLPSINAADRKLRGGDERRAGNTPIQGSAADIVKKAMVAAHKASLPMCLQIHDDIMLDVERDEAADAQATLCRIMESAWELRVPLKAESKIGQSWAEV